MPFQVNLEQPTKFEGSMDHKALTSFMWSVQNFFYLTGLTDPIAQAWLASMWFIDSTAAWLQHQGYNHIILTWATQKVDI